MMTANDMVGFMDRPYCIQTTCCANKDKGCNALTDTHFRVGCPFYKRNKADKSTGRRVRTR